MRKLNENTGTYYIIIKVLAVAALLLTVIGNVWSLIYGWFIVCNRVTFLELLITFLSVVIDMVIYILFAVYVFVVYPKRNTANYFIPIFILLGLKAAVGG